MTNGCTHRQGHNNELFKYYKLNTIYFIFVQSLPVKQTYDPYIQFKIYGCSTVSNTRHSHIFRSDELHLPKNPYIVNEICFCTIFVIFFRFREIPQSMLLKIEMFINLYLFINSVNFEPYHVQNRLLL